MQKLDAKAFWFMLLVFATLATVYVLRALLAFYFLDEASSAMDEGLEHAMYRLLRESLPGATLVSVGHRSSLLGVHTRVLELLGEGRWRLQELPEPASTAAGKPML